MRQHVTSGESMYGVQVVAGPNPAAPTNFLPDVTHSIINEIAEGPETTGTPAVVHYRGLKTPCFRRRCWRVSNTVPTTVTAAPVQTRLVRGIPAFGRGCPLSFVGAAAAASVSLNRRGGRLCSP